MATEDPQYSANLDADINAERDVWTIVNSFNNHGQLADEQLLAALTKNREAMNPLQRKYAELVHADGGVEKTASRERRACFKELNRLYSAIDSIKTNLRLRGIDFEFDHWDEEHPNAAYRRYLRKWEEEWAEQRRQRESANRSDCFVVTATFGASSNELRAARMVCRARFALNPVVAPSWLLYRLVGPSLARIAAQGGAGASVVRTMLAEPIVRASRPSLIASAPWIAYLAIPGWALLGAFLLAIRAACGG